MSRRAVSFVACAACALVVASSRSAFAFGDVTIYDNAQSIPVGGRAAGMAGAYTALSCDEGALHYNVASLSCAAASHLELSANAYVLEGLRATGALGSGGDVSAVTYHSVPSIVGAVRILSEGKERTFFDTYPKRLTFGFTVSVPRSIALKIEPPNPSERNSAAFSIREDLTVGDIGLGYQFDKEVSIGVAVGGVLRTSERHGSWLLASGDDFLAVSGDRSSFALGLHAKVGALVRPYKNLSFGLQLTSPTMHVYGYAQNNSTLTRADPNGRTGFPVRSSGKSEAAIPGRVAFGFAFVKRRYTFSGDLSVNLPNTVRIEYEMQAVAIQGVPSPGMIPDTVLSPRVQPNLNLGASVPFGTTKEVNIGFFTDISSVSQEDIDKNGLSRVHMFGSSLTLGLLGKQARAWIGVAGEIGHTTAKVPGAGFTYEGVSARPAGALPNDGEATLVRWTATGILGSNYSFLD